MTDLYTSSRIGSWRRCPRAHRYRYELGIQTPSGPAAEFGTGAHSALEAWYRQWRHGGDRLGAAFETINAVADPVDAIRLRALIAAYHARWGAEDWDVLEVEREFTYYLDDIAIGGKIDAVIRERDSNRAFVVEHKTSTQDTSAGSPYWAKLALDTQVSIYIDAAEFALDIPVAGCIYDVLKRPQHEPLKATPADQIEYTVGRGCSTCGGSGGGKRGIIQGRGYLEVVFASEVKRPECVDCKGTGWKCDADGNPQSPRPYSKTRLTDESLDEFETRLVSEISAAPDSYLSRGVVVRLDSELPRMRAELIETVTAMRELHRIGLHPPNHSSCSMGRDMCGFFTACSGQASIDDEHVFPRSGIHPELTQTSAA